MYTLIRTCVFIIYYIYIIKLIIIITIKIIIVIYIYSLSLCVYVEFIEVVWQGMAVKYDTTPRLSQGKLKHR